MAQDTTPAIVVYQGDGTNRVFSIPFDAGSGVINVEFILRGATQTYEYSPLTFTINDDNTALTWTGEPLQIGDFICISRSTTAQSLVMYEGDGVKKEFEIPFIRGFYGSIGVAFIYHGNTQTYEYEPKSFEVNSENTVLTWKGPALNAGDYIAIGRSTISGQPYELPNNQKHIEGALDNLARQIQELKDRAVLVIDPTYRVGAPNKQNPIDWLKSIVRSKDFSLRGLRFVQHWMEFSTDNPDKPENEKNWVRVLNTTNITTVREYYDKDKNVRYPEYSTDGGRTWIQFGQALQTQIDRINEEIDDIQSHVSDLYSKTSTNASNIATLKTRADGHDKHLSQHDKDIAELFDSKIDKDQGKGNVGKVLTVGGDGIVVPKVSQGGSGMGAVAHDDTLFGAGTDEWPLGVKDKVTITIVDWE